jgi:prolyl-tRNA editing enzyme YbaK/EbsC (Cys-tRNA(Pro) deacylase)
MAFTLQSATRLLTPAKAVPDQETRIKHQNNSTTTQQHKAMTWAQRLKRVFKSICLKCGGEDKVIACIEDQVAIDKILQHLQAKGVLHHH